MTPRHKDGLGEYARKRDFASTPEPAARGRKGHGDRFVVQEHSARRLHWDLRLERDGVAPSWAIPNGIPDDPSENRKAIRTEDHPLDYLDFEGEIPAGEYGGGTVRIWDRGTYECHKWEEGKVIFSFHGERLHGRYALFRAGGERDWMIHRMDPPEEGRDPYPESLRPMLARPGRLPREESGWAAEVLWRGMRAVAYCRPGRLALQGADLADITSEYGEVHRLTRQIGARPAVLDGMVVALDEEHPVVYAIFDLLYLDGRNLTGEPYGRRREMLEALELSGPAWQTPARAEGRFRELLRAGAGRGLAGLVLKRLDSPYTAGELHRSWREVRV